MSKGILYKNAMSQGLPREPSIVLSDTNLYLGYV
jgi:hypothetical protein